MRKVISVFIVVFFVIMAIGCNSENNDNSTNDNSSTSNDVDVVDNQNEVVELEMLQFDPSVVSKLSGIEGNFEYGYKWKDAAGFNLLIFTREEKFVPWPDADYDDMGDFFIYLKVYHFAGTEDSYSLVRLVQDGELDGCGSPPFGLDCDFFEKSITITDLDKDGYAEATFMYFDLCASELTPVPTKLIMIENGEKYAIRGDSPVIDYNYEGKKEMDFGTAPQVLKDYASQTWDKFITSNPLGY